MSYDARAASVTKTQPQMPTELTLRHVGTEESELRCLESSPAGRRAVSILPGGTGRPGVPTHGLLPFVLCCLGQNPMPCVWVC